MKKLFYLLTVAVAATTMFVACSKDNDEPESGWFDGTITAVVENGNAYNGVVSKVTAEAWDNNSRKFVEIASGSYTNGGFTLRLPATLSDNYLKSDIFGPVKDALKFSDENAKATIEVIISAYNSSGVKVGWFDYGTEAEKYPAIDVSFMYADRDLTITGSFVDRGDTYSYSISLKKGWNKLYNTWDDGYDEYTTKPVSGCKWYFKN